MRTKGRLLSAANHEPRPQTQSETPHPETGVERHWFWRPFLQLDEPTQAKAAGIWQAPTPEFFQNFLESSGRLRKKITDVTLPPLCLPSPLHESGTEED